MRPFLFLSLSLCHIAISATWQDASNDTRCVLSGPAGYSLLGSVRNCSNIVISGLQVPAGQTLDLTKLKNGTTVTFEGNTTWGYREWTGPLVSVSGTNISIKGAPGSALDGSGELWWDEKGQDGKQKPKFFQAHSLSNSAIEGIRIVNAPAHVFSINGCTNLTLANVTINSTLGDRLGKNTDGFDISASSNITILWAMVYNQDDCVAINSGTDIVFRGGLCVGGHGLSVGSIGGRSNNAVKNVVFENSTIKNSQNGVRIKTKYGENGTVDAVTYRHIQLSNITKYGIDVDQSYGATGRAPTSGVKITNFSLANVTGTVDSKATRIFVNCGETSCASWLWIGIAVAGGKKSSKCLYLPSGIVC
ncbi:endopolygalacturonase [Lasiosphaeria miniovina]|uniref:endo-polygalacturonase n=1 Tax=Lasiosphaeria miniovina TaxID=1954250 RepID=A0AA40ADC0_9PEZI|nr:endopolygalacturonase [Lasiosphaeria miniovina]KAK0713791.1 endopolygalacturonase [Lasiosphaeria miniovina]